MGANSRIEWTDHTWNPVVGCTKVSAACDHCYAEGWAKRTGHPELWSGDRRRTSPMNWRLPEKWNREARRSAVRRRVFCASLADVFDNQWEPGWRREMWEVIGACEALDFLLLTKRPQNIRKMLPLDWGDGWPNVWLGTTVENQEEADRRIPHLLKVPARVRFLSCEPLLSAIDLRDEVCRETGSSNDCPACFGTIDWVIAGGESGTGARPCHPEWARGLRDQCVAAGVPYFWKQWGEWRPHTPQAGGDLGADVRGGRVRIVHPTGQTDVEVSLVTGGRNTICGSQYMERVGKKRAGAMLDGREWRQFPVIETADAS